MFKYEIPLPLEIKKNPPKQKKHHAKKFIVRQRSNSNIAKPIPKVIVKQNIDKIEENLLFNFRGIGFSRLRLIDIFNRYI